jgi:hypothetical protein
MTVVYSPKHLVALNPTVHLTGINLCNIIDAIKMDLQEVGGSCGDWMEFAQDRDRWRALVGTVRNSRVP